MKKKFYCFKTIITFLILMSLVLSGCSDNKNKNKINIKTAVYDDNAVIESDITEDKIIEENGLSLEWNNDIKQILLRDIKNNNVFYTTLGKETEKRYDENGMPIKVNPQSESAINVTYYDSDNAAEASLYSYIDAVKKGNIYTKSIPHGIRVIFDFSEQEISIPVDYVIDGGTFKISVNPTEICENKYIVTGIGIAPFMCSLDNNVKDDSYFFIPDGSGAIIRPQEIGTVGSNGSMPVYGGDYAKNQNDFNSYKEQAYLPVFGVKSGNKGLFGIINSGAERSYINWNIGSSNIQNSSVYPYFRIRSYNSIKSPMGIVSYSRLVFNENINKEPISVIYNPLNAENCDYNGMADIYRSYLLKNYNLKEKTEKEYDYSLEIEGGMQQKKYFCGVPYTSFKSLTTITEAQNIAEFTKENNNNALIRLCGFTKSGLDVGKVAGGFSISSKLGSKKSIKELTDYCKKQDIELSFDVDPISFNKRGNGYSIQNSATMFSNNRFGYLNTFDEVTRNATGTRIYMLSRSLFTEVLNKIENKAEGYGFETIGLGKFGKFIYSDFKFPETFNCDNVQEDTVKELNKISKSKKVVLTGANDYAACASDFVCGTPIESSGFDVSLEEIPFYSMIFRGYVSMFSSAINTSEDKDIALLKCAESGIAPTYTVIDSFDRSLISSKYPVTKSSDFNSLKEEIKEDSLKMQPLFKAISNSKIVKHNTIKNNLKQVTYDNGTVVYINYGTQNEEYNGINIKPLSFCYK